MVSKEQIYQARGTQLFNYLLQYHHSDVIKEGHELRLSCDNSVVITEGYYGFKDYGDNRNGNSIDLLTEYFDYSFEQAVNCLLGADIRPVSAVQPKEFSLPKHGKNNNKVLEYLHEVRGIDIDILQNLIDVQLLYQDDAENCVFCNREGSYFELRGTRGKRFFRCKDKSKDHDNLWFFNKPYTKKIDRIYVTEDAIDSISLYQLTREDAFFCSIGGVSNYSRVERIKALDLDVEIVTAFDNDLSGVKGRQRHNDLKSITPEGCKDWNELLRKEQYV